MGTPEEMAGERHFTPPEDIREKIAKIIKSAVGREGSDEPYFRAISITEATAQILALFLTDVILPPRKRPDLIITDK